MASITALSIEINSASVDDKEIVSYSWVFHDTKQPYLYILKQ